MAHHCEDAIRARARERQEATQFGGGGNFTTTGEKARDELGKMAGVSGSTYSHAVTVLESAPEAVKDAVSLPCEPGSSFPEIWITADFVLQKSVEQKPIIAADIPQKSAGSETRDELAKVAGVSLPCGAFLSVRYRSSPGAVARPVGLWTW